ncbi:DNA-binding protein [Pseudomonas aeruginosa]|uniref:DNA-binding protein n=1 Tax=Pseudomonas aeruginosa TaxID=287 RepID=UPI000F7E2C9B|nr:DNA-binding protein [Pseudomonas aeruginosa]RTB35165.1 DNA-binding protein [Pseudomonas aeruginosa]RTC37284.1 DNA-binding protein [Pseudomonas aeruginosa]RTC66127.1 DNA-binding protein [Pseudomonas aeruginosa]
MTVEETLLNRYGGSPLLSLEQLAEVLHRSKNGLRISLSGDNELSAKLRPGKVKIGRRIYFKTAAVARVIEEA